MTTPFKHGMYCPRCNRSTEHKIIKFGKRPYNKEMNGRKYICEECGEETSIIIGLPEPPKRLLEVCPVALSLTKKIVTLALILTLSLTFIQKGYPQEAPATYWENNDIIVRGSIFTNNLSLVLYEVENKNTSLLHIKLAFNPEKFKTSYLSPNGFQPYNKLDLLELKSKIYFMIETPNVQEQKDVIGEKYTFIFYTIETNSELRTTLHIINYVRLEATLDVYKGWTFQTLLDAYTKTANEKTALEESFSRYQLASATAMGLILIICTLLGVAFGVLLKGRFLKKRGLRR